MERELSMDESSLGLEMGKLPDNSISLEQQKKLEEELEEGAKGITAIKKRRREKNIGSSPNESSAARRESHKIIEQKRRQKINEKIAELRELLNYPDGSTNKAAILQAAVDNIKNLKIVCTKLLGHHKQLQEDYVHLLAENQRLQKGNGISSHVNDNSNNNSSKMPNSPIGGIPNLGPLSDRAELFRLPPNLFDMSLLYGEDSLGNGTQQQVIHDDQSGNSMKGDLMYQGVTTPIASPSNVFLVSSPQTPRGLGIPLSILPPSGPRMSHNPNGSQSASSLLMSMASDTSTPRSSNLLSSDTPRLSELTSSLSSTNSDDQGSHSNKMEFRF